MHKTAKGLIVCQPERERERGTDGCSSLFADCMALDVNLFLLTGSYMEGRITRIETLRGGRENFEVFFGFLSSSRFPIFPSSIACGGKRGRISSPPSSSLPLSLGTQSGPKTRRRHSKKCCIRSDTCLVMMLCHCNRSVCAS